MTRVGEAEHERTVARLRESYAQIPSGQQVRLRKRTSNLFRRRAPGSGPGLDVSGLSGVISVDEHARTADVQGMCAYEHLVNATLDGGIELTAFADGRVIVHGTADAARARSIYARFIGA